jgi:hypothetical protein
MAAATVDTIRGWFKVGIETGQTHMLVVCDTFDWEDYPVYVPPDKNVDEVVPCFMPSADNMQQVMEVYDLRNDMEAQLLPGVRAWHTKVKPQSSTEYLLNRMGI